MRRMSTTNPLSGQDIAIGLVDNDPYALAYLRVAIERLDQRFHMMWAVSTGAAAVHRCLHATRLPDVLVVDMSLTDMTGAEVCATVRRSGAAVGVVGITALDPRLFGDALARAGGQALVAKERIPRMLRPAIMAAAQGKAYRPTVDERADATGEGTAYASFVDVKDDLSRRDGYSRTGRTGIAGSVRLSERELSIIRLYGRHLSTKDIARELGISPSTIHVHMHHAMRKLGVATRQEVIRICGEQQRL